MVIARSLAQALREAGHQADIVVTPQNRFGRQASAYIATWLTDVGQSAGHPIDQVISLRYPSYAVRHPRHVCWLNHTMREYYDLWPRFRQQLKPPGVLKESVRRTAIRRVDTWLLRRLDRRFTISDTVRRRLEHFNGVSAETLHPPAPPRDYRCERFEPFVLAISRLSPLKRLDLVLEALATSDAAGVRCVVVGEGECASELRQLAVERGIASRVEFLGHVGDAALLDWLARCRAVVFPPLDEDYGFVTVEAFASGKPVITTTDSGGPAELVRDGQTGLVVEPTPRALGAAMRRLIDDSAGAERMGASARRVSESMTWASAVRRLIVV